MNFEDTLRAYAENASENWQIHINFGHDERGIKISRAAGPVYFGHSDDSQAFADARFVQLCSPERMAIVADLITEVRHQNASPVLASILKRLDEVE